MNIEDINIISLGSFCQVAGSLSRIDRREIAYPFDYIRSNPKMIIDCISNNFSKFLDKKGYIKNNDNDSIGIKEYGSDVFVHHNILDDDVYESFVRRSERFMEKLESNEKKIFISLFQPWDDTTSAMINCKHPDLINDCIDLNELLQKYPNCEYHVIINNFDDNRRIENVYDKDGLKIYNFYSKSCSLGYKYTDLDESILQEKIKTIITTI